MDDIRGEGARGTGGVWVEIRRIRRTVNAPHTSWRFMNSYETSLVKCGEDGTSRSPSIRMSSDGYLSIRLSLSLSLNLSLKPL
jgi:hypothetical protein